MATIEQPPVAAEPQRAAITNGRWIGYARLLQMRMLELWREPEVIFWVFVFPLLLALGLGIAFRSKPADVTPVAVVDGPKAQEILSLLQRSPEHASFHAGGPECAGCARWLSAGQVRAGRQHGRRRRSAVSLRSCASGERAGAHASRRCARNRRGPQESHQHASTASSEPGARYIDFLIPGLLGMNLMNSGMWGIGFALVEMRQRKLLKRFVATPMRRSDFLLALASSRLVLMLIEVALLLVFGVLVFHVRVEGSILSILLIGALGAVSFGGVGLLTASRAQKIESVSGLINLVMMPMWIFSGVFFSYERFPKMFLPAIRALPLTALNDALRADHSSGCDFQLTTRPDRRAGDLGWRVVCAGAALVPLELRGLLAALATCARSSCDTARPIQSRRSGRARRSPTTCG